MFVQAMHWKAALYAKDNNNDCFVVHVVRY